MPQHSQTLKLDLADTAATNANTKAGLANTAASNAEDNVINSVSFGDTDIIFKKENESTISLANAREILKGDSGVYIGETAPDNGATVWIDTTGMPSRMYFRDTHVQVSDFVADATHTKYPFKADVVCLGTTPDLFAFVVFSSESLIEFIYAPFCESGTDIVTIYSTKKTDRGTCHSVN